MTNSENNPQNFPPPNHDQPVHVPQHTKQASSFAGQTHNESQGYVGSSYHTPPTSQATTPVRRPAYGAAQQRSQAERFAYEAQQSVPPQPRAPQASKKSKSGGGGKTFLLGFLGAALACALFLVGFSVFGSLGFLTSPSNTTEVQPSQGESTVLGSGSNEPIAGKEADATLAVSVAQKTLPSVVSIDTFAAHSPMSPFGFSSDDESMVELSLGSGVILSEDGYIITNHHVVDGAKALEVTIEGETYSAEVVGVDSSSDLAVIKAKDATGLKPIEVGNSSDLVIGEWVMAIGSPFGFEQSVATGIVSATSRSTIMESATGGDVAIYTNLIQTDAAINPGNSGGALVNAQGKLVGINTLISSYSGSYSGVGFAIPVDYAISIAQQIIEGKTPSHAQLGISLSTVNPSLAQRYGLEADRGAYVTQVYAGSAADSAGVKVGDIVTKFNGKTVASASDLILEVRSCKPGDKVSFEINRSGQVIKLEATLGSDVD